MIKMDTTLKQIQLNVSQSSSSLEMVLPSSARLTFLPFDEFWANNGKAVLQKLLLSVTFIVSRFSK